MSGGVQLFGMDELRKALTDAPAAIRAEGMEIVRDETEQAARDYVAGLPRKSGRLARLVRTVYPAATSVLLGLVVSAAPHAAIVDGGTEPRRTTRGANRGRMPALPSSQRLGAIAPRRRARMYRRLGDLLERMGFEVRGV